MNGRKENKGKDRTERLIAKRGLRIRKLFCDKEADLILFLLNDRNLIQRRISEIPFLKEAPENSLKNYRLTPFDVHWPELDEDLGLKGLLEEEDLMRFEKAAPNTPLGH